MEEQLNTPNKKTQKKPTVVAALSVTILVLLVAIGYFIWQLVLLSGENAKIKQSNSTLQAKVDDLDKKLLEAQAKKAEKSSETSPVCSATITDSLKANIKSAVESKNYAALEGYMASSVNVVLAASEKGGNVSPAQAVIDLAYLSNGTAPWDFNLSTATINSYKTGFYKQYFEGSIYVGKSSDGLVVSFGFNECAKINRIFISPSADLLV